VNTTVTGFTQPALHVVYPDASYEVTRLGKYFRTIGVAWQHVLVLAHYREDIAASGPSGTNFDLPIPLLLSRRGRRHIDRIARKYEFGRGDLTVTELQLVRENVDETRQRLVAEQLLTFENINLNSPLDITLAIQAAGGTGITVYALYLLSAVLRDPERLGGWLPRLVAGWHKARRDLARIRDKDMNIFGSQREGLVTLLCEEEVAKLRELSQQLRELKPRDVTVSGAGTLPEDITKALETLDQWE
jgi:hypothetical protein